MKYLALVSSSAGTLILLAGALVFQEPRPQPVEPVELNHVVMTVDQATYDALVASPYLRDVFANGGVATVAGNAGDSWTARYVVGENLYLEVFGPEGRQGRNPGYVGLAFSTRTMGDIDRIEERLNEVAGERAHRILRTRQARSEVRNWFHAVSVDPPSFDRRLGAWVMESHPDHLRRIGLEVDRLPARDEYLAALRRARSQPMPAPSRLLRDVTRIDLVLTEKEASDLSTLLLAAGWDRDAAQGDHVRLSGGGLELQIRFDPQPDPPLRAIEFALTWKPEEERTVDFNERSRLTVHADGSARWVFDDTEQEPE